MFHMYVNFKWEIIFNLNKKDQVLAFIEENYKSKGQKEMYSQLEANLVENQIMDPNTEKLSLFFCLLLKKN